MDDFTDIITWQPPQRHKNGCGFVWNKDDDERLAALWPHNSAGIIARIMIPPRSRNAVIGRAHRLGLGMKVKKSAERKRVRRVKSLLPRPKLYPKTDKPKVEIAIDPQGWAPIGVTLLEAERHHCRAIVAPAATAGSGNVMCCGHTVTHPVFSFCEYHLELYTESAHGRRRSHWRHWSHARK